MHVRAPSLHGGIFVRVAVYARVSTGTQDEELQLPRIRDYCGRAGWDIIQEYSDVATGKNCNRPGWQALMSDARARKFDRIVVTKLDRIMRSLRILGEELDTLKVYDVDIFALDAGLLDAKTPNGAFLVHILGTIAEWEGAMISTRTKEGLEARRARGEVLGRPSADIPLHMVALNRLAGKSWKDCSIEFGINVSTLRNHRAEIEKEMEEIRASL